MLAFRLFVGILLLGLISTGCDQVPALDFSPQRPSVYGLDISPDSLSAADLDSSLVQDSVAQVPVEVAVQAEDPDGEVERVVFTFEPSSNPRGAAFGQLEERSEGTYGQRFGLSLPLRDEVYTVRVYAVDDDSLSSNQGIGRFRFSTEP
mgnify:CR=1 FL=1